MSFHEQIDEQLQEDSFSQNPYPLYARLRNEAPVFWSDLWGCWLLSSHRDIMQTLSDSKRFSSGGRLTAVFESEISPSLEARVRPLIKHYNTGLINVDGPDHSRLRRLVHQGFTPSSIARLEASIREIVQELLTKAATLTEIDFVRDFAYPLPITVITKMMGIPYDEREDFKKWSGTIVRFMATPRPCEAILIASNDALVRVRERFRELSAERLSKPGDDLITSLVQARDEGDRLSEEEMISTLTTILIGGHETTTNLLGSSLLRLHQFPEQRNLLYENPDRIPNAVEELLRYDGPFQRARRVATIDTQLGDQQIRKGDVVLQFLGSANRDPSVFPNPDNLDFTREPIKHISFSRGSHFCLGAALARLETRIAIFEWIHGPWNIEPLEDTPIWNNGMLRGLHSLRTRISAA